VRQVCAYINQVNWHKEMSAWVPAKCESPDCQEQRAHDYQRR
jgi:hypothetical protein